MSAWRRFVELPLWAKLSILGGSAAVVVGAVLLVLLVRGGSGPSTQVLSPTARPTAIPTVPAAPTQPPPTEPPAPTRPPDRTNCDVIRQLAAGKDFLFADLGETELRGFEDPVKLWELRWQGDA